MNALGKTTWLVPDCYWPEITTPGHYVSHESICVLNTGDADAHLRFTLYFEDAEPMTGFSAVCAARRTHHVRMDKLLDDKGRHVPIGVPYAALMESDVPVVAQYSRIDTTQPNETLATTIAFSL
ncbi:MAG: hypothetical protein GX558_12735 [Clostridiales bacterium]|nr:hypothetical protein [Clostridiales bacterium]